MTKGIQLTICLLLSSVGLNAQSTFPKDTIDTENEPLTITFIGHGSLIFEWNGEVIHIDPSSRKANYYKLPKATMVFVTHDHGFDEPAQVGQRPVRIAGHREDHVLENVPRLAHRR